MVEVVIGDITEMEVDAIVNPANEYLIMGGGVAGAIKRKGGEEIEKEALKHSPIPIGKAIATTAGKLKAKFVIHAPTVKTPGGSSTIEWVKMATEAAISEARRLKVKSIAFPLMGAGVGGLSPKESYNAMMEVLGKVNDIKVIIVVRDEATYRNITNL
ncbi:MAG: macro domain-containing protein [Sulfolobaceae archaeon]